MLRPLCSGVVLALLSSQALAEDSPWLLRARAVHLSPANKSEQLGGNGASDRLQLNSKTIPELDGSYFFTPHLAAELVLTYPQKHTVALDGASIGTIKHLPPTLTAQYHFMPDATVSPYLGAGVNYTTFSKVNLLGGQGRLEHDSFGLALQAGGSYKINRRWSANIDIKKLQLRSEVFIAGAHASRVKVDPFLVGIGAGYRF